MLKRNITPRRKVLHGFTAAVMAEYDNCFMESSILVEKPKTNIKKNNSASKENIEFKNYKILLCAIAKLENKYIREWVEHYKNLGFTNICLFDNNDVDGERFEDVINDYIEDGFVKLIDARGNKKYQIEAYNKCYNEFGNEYDWIAFFDIDEFLMLDEKFSNINDFLNNRIYSKYNCIRICWENYGDNDLVKVVDGNYNCKERFTKPLRGDNESKIIVKTKLTGKFRTDNPHVFLSSQIKCCNTNGVTCVNANTNGGSRVTLSNAKLNHYKWKTIEEYVLGKMKRLWPTNYKNGGKNFITLDWFFRTNKKTDEKVKYAKELMENEKKSDILNEKDDRLSIAIVGNSPCALGAKKGQEIDSHDIVLRFNNFHIKGYEEDLGSKTTMMAVVSVIRDYKKTEQFLSLPKECRIFRDDHNPPDTVPIEKVFSNKVKEEDVIRVDDYIKKVKDRMPNYKQNHYPSTGLVMMQYLADKYPNAKIDAYAITFFAEKKIHIYDNATGLYHDRNAEIKYFDEYLKDKITLHNEKTEEKKKTIAIVGNSPILMNTEYGEEIDSHDIVVRINHFNLEGYEKHLGTKTTDVYFHTKTLYSPTILTLTKEHRFMFYTRETHYQIRKLLNDTYKGKLKLENVTLLDRKKYFLDLAKKINSKEHKHASTGLITIQSIVDRYPDCDIDVYGITFFADSKNNKMSHYDGTQYIMAHDNKAEIEYFNKNLSDKVNLK